MEPQAAYDVTLTASQRALLREHLARSKPPLAVDIEAMCGRCPPQAKAVADPSRNVIVCAGRRSSKSYGAVLRGLMAAAARPGVSAVYTAATHQSVKRIAWEAARYWNRTLGLGAEETWSTPLTLTLKNRSRLYLFGVDSEKAADIASRGIHRLAFMAIDEVQRYRDDVAKTYIKAVRPALRDVGGTLWLMGTPNPRGKTGALWERIAGGRYSVHTWTTYDNGFLGSREDAERIIAEDLAAEGETKEGAFYRREYLAEWVVDMASRAYQFDDALNIYDTAPEGLATGVLSVDVGYGDADAVADLRWRDKDPTMYLVRENVRSGQTVSQLGDVLVRMYDPNVHILIPVDAGGGGKKTFASLQATLPQLPLVEAVKPEVRMQVKALNDRLRGGLLKVHRDSRFAADVRQVGWVDGVAGGKLDEKSFHSDIIPACRYGVIAARPFLPDFEVMAEETDATRQRDARAARLRRGEKAARAREPGAEADIEGSEAWQDLEDDE